MSAQTTPTTALETPAKFDLLSDDELHKLILAHKGILSEVASELAIAPQTIRVRVEKSEKLQNAIYQAREDRIDRAESGLDAAIARREPWALSLVLKTLGKKRGYTEKIEIEGADKPGTMFGPNFLVVVIEHKGQQPKDSLLGESVVDGEIQLEETRTKEGAPSLQASNRD